MSRKSRRDPGRLLAGVVMLFYFTAFGLLSLRKMDRLGMLFAVAVPAMIWIGTHLLPRLFPTDKLLLSLTNFLCALGILMLYATHPRYAVHQAVSYGVGLVAMVVCIMLVRHVKQHSVSVWLLMPLALLFLALPLLIGKEINGATNWIRISGHSVQPSELVKVALVIILSHWMSRRSMLPWLGFALVCLGLLMLQKDLGTALMYYGVTLALYYVSSGHILLTGIGLLGGGASAVLGYQMFAHVRKRVAIWRNPFGTANTSGYQIVQGLIALASGGLFGVGLGLGAPRTIPAYHTDYIFAVICEQFGLIFGLCVLAMYVALVWRGATIAMGARSSYHGLIAMGATVLIALQTFTIIGGVIKLIPLTGVTLPFVSYGGSSLVSSLCLIGLVQGVGSLNEDHLNQDTELATAVQGGMRS